MELVKSLKSSKIVKYAFIALIGSIALAISSKIKIPFYPVPMTMQTLVVIMIGAAFGWKLGLATVSLYLFEGIIGLPVFSGTPEKGVGLVYFTGPTMGYLIGFLVAVFFGGVNIGAVKQVFVCRPFIADYSINKLVLTHHPLSLRRRDGELNRRYRFCHRRCVLWALCLQAPEVPSGYHPRSSPSSLPAMYLRHRRE